MKKISIAVCGLGWCCHKASSGVEAQVFSSLTESAWQTKVLIPPSGFQLGKPVSFIEVTRRNPGDGSLIGQKWRTKVQLSTGASSQKPGNQNTLHTLKAVEVGKCSSQCLRQFKPLSGSLSAFSLPGSCYSLESLQLGWSESYSQQLVSLLSGGKNLVDLMSFKDFLKLFQVVYLLA